MLLDLRFLWEVVSSIVLAAADFATAADDAAILASLANDDPAAGTENAAVLAAPVGSDLGAVGDTLGVAVFATGSDASTEIDAAAVLAIVTPDTDPATGTDAGSITVLVLPDDAGSGADLAQISAAATAAELLAPSDDLSINATIAASNEDAVGVDDAQVSVVEFLTAGDSATADEAASIVESLPTEPTPVGLGTQVRRPRPNAQGAEIGEGAAAREDGFVYASMHGGDRATSEHFATVERWPDPRYANPAILAMVAALEDAA